MKISEFQQDIPRLIHRNARTSLLSIMEQNNLHDFEELCEASVNNDADEAEKLIEKLVTITK